MDLQDVDRVDAWIAEPRIRGDAPLPLFNNGPQTTSPTSIDVGLVAFIVNVLFLSHRNGICPPHSQRCQTLPKSTQLNRRYPHIADNKLFIPS